jgi:hypothetical protein
MGREDQDHKREMLEIYKRNLRVLEEQHAKMGMYAPPFIVNQIREIREHILRLESEGGIVMDPISAITLIGSGLKLIDQFRELVIRLRGQVPTPPSAKAELAGTALEVRQSNVVTQKVEANQLLMDQWDTPRYEALRSRVQRNWLIYNDLFTSEAGASAQDGARIRADMRNIQDTLCADFREMVRPYERALGISLPDHYQLYEVCHA